MHSFVDKVCGSLVPFYNASNEPDRPQGYRRMTSSGKAAQVHVRVGSEFKRALKMFCVREGTTEQAWIVALLEAEVSRLAPDLWPRGARLKLKRKAGK